MRVSRPRPIRSRSEPLIDDVWRRRRATLCTAATSDQMANPVRTLIVTVGTLAASRASDVNGSAAATMVAIAMIQPKNVNGCGV
jgi:hypothetical protein